MSYIFIPQCIVLLTFEILGFRFSNVRLGLCVSPFKTKIAFTRYSTYRVEGIEIGIQCYDRYSLGKHIYRANTYASVIGLLTVSRSIGAECCFTKKYRAVELLLRFKV